MRKTIQIIGDAIVDGSRYLPIRNRAAALASLAPPKDYLAQVKNVFQGFIKNWRYVRDPFGRELVHRSPKQVFEMVMGGSSDSPGVGFGKGAGDCDDATIAIGAQLASIGFPVRIATIAPRGAPAGPLMTHVFAQAQIPGYGWLTVDPVVHPNHGLGYTPPHARMATYDLTGLLMSTSGNVRGLSGLAGADAFGDINDGEDQTMRTNIDDWQDQTDLGFGDYLGDDEPLLDFQRYGVTDFGRYANSMGMMSGLGLMAEVDVDENGMAWTPNLEIAPEDYSYLMQRGSPYHGMLGLSDEAEPYVYDEGMGFFRKLFRRVKKRVKKVAKRIRGGIRKVAGSLKKFGKKLLKKLPGGKFLLKLGSKIWKIAKKIVKPLAKLLGPLAKWAKRLAPIAAIIPGVGPAIAVAMYKAGKITELMNKYSVKSVMKKAGKVGKLRFPSGKVAKKFRKALKKAAKKTKKARKRGRSIRKASIARGIAPGLPTVKRRRRRRGKRRKMSKRDMFKRAIMKARRRIRSRG